MSGICPSNALTHSVLKTKKRRRALLKVISLESLIAVMKSDDSIDKFFRKIRTRAFCLG